MHKHHVMNTYTGVKAYLTSTPDRAEWSSSRFYWFTPMKRDHDTQRTAVCVGPRTGMDVKANRKIPAPDGNRTSDVQLVARHCTDWAILVPPKMCKLLKS
jgi:hypothetical protein